MVAFLLDLFLMNVCDEYGKHIIKFHCVIPIKFGFIVNFSFINNATCATFVVKRTFLLLVVLGSHILLFHNEMNKSFARIHNLITRF